MAPIRQRGENWEVRVRRTGHKLVCKSFKSKREAERWARSVEHAQDRGRRSADPGRRLPNRMREQGPHYACQQAQAEYGEGEAESR